MDHSRREMRSRSAVGLSVMAALLLVSFSIRAQPQERPSGSRAAPAGDAENGKKLYNTIDCFRCHGDSGQGGSAGSRLAPNSIPLLAFIEYIRAPAGAMPPYTTKVVSDAQLADIYAFLRTVPPPQERSSSPATAPTGNAENGKKLYNAIGCWQCHGYSAQGGRAGSRLAPNPIPFPAFAKYIRAPGGEMPPYTTMVVSDAQLADIYAFLTAIPPPRDAKDIPLLNKKEG